MTDLEALASASTLTAVARQLAIEMETMEEAPSGKISKYSTSLVGMLKRRSHGSSNLLAPTQHRSTQMGMSANFSAVSPQDLERLRTDPSLIEDHIFAEDGEADAPNSIDVDKAWHGIHYMLTGKASGGEEPLSMAVMGGEEFGEEVGYGPARFLLPAQVEAIAGALQALGEPAFRARFAPQDMANANIYPKAIWVREGEEALKFVMENYEGMVQFYVDAAKRGDGAILWLS